MASGASSGGGSSLNPGHTSQFGGIMGTMSNALGGMGNNLMQAYGMKNAQGQWAAGYQPSRNPFVSTRPKQPAVEVVNLKDTEDALPIPSTPPVTAKQLDGIAQTPIPHSEDDSSIPKGPIPITIGNGAPGDVVSAPKGGAPGDAIISDSVIGGAPGDFVPASKHILDGFTAVRGTAYNGKDDKYGSTTARPNMFGQFKAIEGSTIAVDPRLIPFGAQVQVVNKKGQPVTFGGNTTGIYTAHDTGSAVKSRQATKGGSPVLDFFTKGKDLSALDAQLNKDELYFKILRDRAAGKPTMSVAEASRITGDVVR